MCSWWVGLEICPWTKKHAIVYYDWTKNKLQLLSRAFFFYRKWHRHPLRTNIGSNSTAVWFNCRAVGELDRAKKNAILFYHSSKQNFQLLFYALFLYRRRHHHVLYITTVAQAQRLFYSIYKPLVSWTGDFPCQKTRYIILPTLTPYNSTKQNL